jgi:hypothetical protein
MTSPKIPEVNLTYPLGGRDTAKSGMGCWENRHLHDLVESIIMNVGGPYVEVSSPPVKRMGVGAVIVLRARESCAHGEGRQFVGKSSAE